MTHLLIKKKLVAKADKIMCVESERCSYFFAPADSLCIKYIIDKWLICLLCFGKRDIIKLRSSQIREHGNISLNIPQGGNK